MKEGGALSCYGELAGRRGGAGLECTGTCGQGAEKEGRRWEKGEKKMGKRKMEREREIVPAGFAAATATGRARAPVGRDAWNEEEQRDGTANEFGCRDMFFGRLGDRAGDDFGWIELNDEKRFENIFSA